MPLLRALVACLAIAVFAGVLGQFASGAGAETGHAADVTWAIEGVDVAGVPVKATTPGLDAALSALVQAGNGAPNPNEGSRLAGLSMVDDRVRVVVETDPAMAGSAAAAILRAEGVLELTYEGWLQAMVPVGSLTTLAADSAVRFVRAPYSPQTSAITSEGIAGMGLERWHNTGLTGTGAKLAILDLGFDGYWNVVGTEIPEGTVVRSFRADQDITGGGDIHGTAAAEVAFDVAPSATFYLVNFATEGEMGQAVDWLISEGVDVISSSVGWPGTAYGDGQGSLNGIVAKAERAGIVWVQASGNYGNTHWTGFFTDPEGNGFHNFSGPDEGNTIRLRRASPSDERVFRIEVFLTWDDWDTLNQDYDLFLFRGESVVAQSTAFQNGQFPPVEHLVYSTAAPGDYWVGVQRFRASRRTKLDIVVTADFNLEYREPAESLVVPADSPSALTVGAVAPNTLTPRNYSSRGPTKDGRPKPELVSGDGVSTFILGPGGFSGTSAAAPAVAGAAALYRGARPGTRPPVVRRFLTGRAQGGSFGNMAIGSGNVFLGELPPAVMFPMAGKRGGVGSRY